MLQTRRWTATIKGTGAERTCVNGGKNGTQAWFEWRRLWYCSLAALANDSLGYIISPLLLYTCLQQSVDKVSLTLAGLR